MAQASRHKERCTWRLLKPADNIIFVGLLIALVATIALFSQANIVSDSIDYYAILQKLTGGDHPPIVQNLHFMEQRSPGYSLSAAIPYYLVSEPLGMLVRTQQVTVPGNSTLGLSGGQMLEIPPDPLPVRDIFFKDFLVDGSVFQWKVILALLIASYVALFAGILFMAGTLRLEGRKIPGISLVLLVIMASPVFMTNILQTPTYATLFAFGVSAAFCYFFVRAGHSISRADELLCGMLAGLLVLTRLETALLLLTVLLMLLFYRKLRFFVNLASGALLALPVLLAYNMAFFGNPFHMGILAGDINVITLNAGYIANCLVTPASSILFWSTLTVAGIVGLATGKEYYYRVFLACSLVMIGLYLVRVPVMYLNAGSGAMSIGGVPVGTLSGVDETLALVRSDMNRYLTLLVPFAVLGIRSLIDAIASRLPSRQA